MKKFILSFVIMMAAWMGVNAMSFERAQAEALYLTDKMAYELNLNDQQYNDAYEINLDYFLRIDSPSDLYGSYYTYRLYDLRCILHDWQYSLLTAADYFLRPIIWRAGGWYFPIYSYYNRGYFYYSRPSVWVSYYGGHGRSYYRDGFYANRRPHWDGGLRGHDMHRVVGHAGGRDGGHRPGVGGRDGGRRISGNGYHIDMNGHRPGSNGGNRGGGNHGDMGSGNHDNHGVGGGNHDGGNHNGGMNPGGSNHNGGSNSGMNPGGGRSSGSGVSRGSSFSRGNSFDSSSSRMSSSHSGSYSSSRSTSPSMSGSRSSSSMSRGSSMGSSHSSSPSMSRGSSMGSSRSSSSSMSRGSSMGSSRGGGFGGGSRGGGFGGGSRGGGGGSRGGGRR